MIILVFIISGFFGECSVYWIILRTNGRVGPSFWDQRFLAFTRLDHIPQVVEIVPDIGLNEAFMAFSAFGLAFNIVSRYFHVF